MSISATNGLVNFSIPSFINYIGNGSENLRPDVQEIINEIVTAAKEDGYKILE